MMMTCADDEGMICKLQRYLWDAKGLFMELKQDVCGVIDKERLLSTLIDSTDQMDKEAESYLGTCTSIENFYASFQVIHAYPL